jgi:DNA (cytosine-5)-methyltransferase 1
MKFKHGSLFTGIDVFGEAAKENGFTNEFGCDTDPLSRQFFIEKNEGKPFFGDIREIQSIPYVDLLTFGFPCQDVSQAQPIKNNNPLYEGERTVLFWEAMRLVDNATRKPTFIIAENVEALRWKGLEIVLRRIAQSGYIPTYATLCASKFGASHRRARVFIIAHAHGIGWDTGIRILGKVADEGKNTGNIRAEFHRSFFDGIRAQAQRRGHGNYNEPTQRLFDGLLVRAVGNSIYYPIAQALTREIQKELIKNI